MKKYISVLFIVLLLNCNRLVILPAYKDVYISSIYPDINFNGKREADKGFGYGTKKNVSDNYITYPALYLTNSEDEKASIIIGGFDLNSVKKDIIHASLKFFINWASNDRKNITIFIRPVLQEWHEDKITFNDVYQKSDSGYILGNIAERDDKLCKIIVFDIKKNDYKDNTIPFSGSYKTVSVNITEIIKKVINDKRKFYGFLIEPMDLNDFRYITTNMSNVISDIGIIEIACIEWFTWDGMIPAYFYLKNGRWINLKNKAKNKMKYIPRIEITVSGN
ncbi:MAG: DNRLRE domain-containing protein [Spirochaetes bacterium]|nr:DNRLRE domain-containing protein [Spirochaetota bacterium]